MTELHRLQPAPCPGDDQSDGEADSLSEEERRALEALASRIACCCPPAPSPEFVARLGQRLASAER